jgi:hypothetical protein
VTLKISTGIAFLDSLLDGGQLACGLHGLLGTIGSGKTTLGSMIAIEGARIEYERARRKEQAGRWVFVTVDQPATQIEQLAISHAARIRRTAVDGRTPISEELDAWACETQGDAGAAVTSNSSERQRLQWLHPLRCNHLHLVDLSILRHFDGSPHPVDYLSRRIKMLAVSTPIAGIVVDYVGLLVNNFNFPPTSDGSPRKSSTLIRQFVAKARNQLARQFDCPVWLIHQLNGAANGMSPVAVQHHQDAAECKHFGDALDTCLCLGRKDQTGAVLLNCSKALSVDELPPPVLLEFDPNFASLIPAVTNRVSVTLSRVIEKGSAEVKIGKETRERMLARIARNQEQCRRPASDET